MHYIESRFKHTHTVDPLSDRVQSGSSCFLNSLNHGDKELGAAESSLRPRLG